MQINESLVIWTNTCMVTHLFFIFFFLGDSSSEPFLPLPLDPRFSLSPRVSPSVKCIDMFRCMISVLQCAKMDPISKLTYFSLLSPLHFHSRSIPISPSAHSRTVPDLHLVCGYVCPPAVRDFMLISVYGLINNKETN